MYSKSHLTSLIAAASIASDHEAIMRLRSLPYHDRSKGKGKSKPGKVYRKSTNKFVPHQGVQECARRMNRATR